MRWNELDEEICSLARTMSVIGDRWMLLILRECFTKVRRFEDFQSRLGISRGVLAERLKKLTDNFILTKVAYQQDPLRHEYRLTPKGLKLYPIMMSLVHWGDEHMAGKAGRPIVHVHDACGSEFDPVMTCSECGEILDPRHVHVYPGPGAPRPHNLPFMPESVTAPPPGTRKRKHA